MIPSQSMEFLGFQVDSVSAQLLLPLKKRIAIKKELRKALSVQTISLRTLARLVGLLASPIQVIFPGPLHYRALQRLKILHLRKGHSYTEQILIMLEARTEISWWLDHMDAWNGRAIFASVPEIVIESDASRWGWGARCWSVETGGRWSQEELKLHINCLELLAGSFALRTLSPHKGSYCLLLRMDNVSAVPYLNRLGGTRSRLLVEITKDFWHYCLQNHISVTAEYISGCTNVVRTETPASCGIPVIGAFIPEFSSNSMPSGVLVQWIFLPPGSMPNYPNFTVGDRILWRATRTPFFSHGRRVCLMHFPRLP